MLKSIKAREREEFNDLIVGVVFGFIPLRDLSCRRLRFLWAELESEFFLFVIDLIFCSIEAITKIFSTWKMDSQPGKKNNILGILLCA